MIEENPYYDVKRISNSSLKNINPSEGGHPKKYKAFISGDSEKKNTLSLDRGKLLHKWVENKDAFEVSEVDAPHEEAIKWLNLVLILEKEWSKNNLEELPKETLESFILSTKEKVTFHDNYKKKEAILALFYSFSNYYNFIKYPSNKIALTSATRDILFNCYQSLYIHPRANSLLFTELKDCIILNEQAIYFEIDGVECKSLLDRVIIDNKYKTIKIIDLKTTSKPIGNYSNEFTYYHTYRQLAFYGKAIIELLKQLDYKDIEEYEISYHIVAVETIGQFITQVFDIDIEWINKGIKEYLELIKLISWHTSQDKWELTKDEYFGNSILEYNEFKYLKNQ